ncbi:cupin domain-containing protein [Oleiagrimonas citrea]|uniref:Cupin n=1 Tax=Oleiagrimonas citrea TaxID=1665687 RepID=A0A846ZLU3_9GAMM|nr:cupin domain-containing protein [Oleiagrimonas citrea]NKZ38647.1 cupin [Oleiagrimonas citrea]
MTVIAPLKLHADLDLRACVDAFALPWTPSPAAGVERRLIERDGAEAARATSLVRYAPDSRFPSHTHPRGEEILVLEGTFGDEFGDYPPGTYLRNPPGSSHAPRTDEGCTIFVKLRHMHPLESERVVVDTAERPWCASAVRGLEIMPLGGFRGERAALVRLASGTRVPLRRHAGGCELLVLGGALRDDDGTYPAGTWLRLPRGSRQSVSSDKGCTVFVKAGHLR